MELRRPFGSNAAGPLSFPAGKTLSLRRMKIAVLGGGHGAYAAAANLSEQGHEVRVWRRGANAFAPLLASSSHTPTDQRRPRPGKITPLFTTAADAVVGAEPWLLPGPSTA